MVQILVQPKKILKNQCQSILKQGLNHLMDLLNMVSSEVKTTEG